MTVKHNEPLQSERIWKQVEPYMIISGRLYKQELDKGLRLCTDPEDYTDIIYDAHISLGRYHACPNWTHQRVLLNGFWWPTLMTNVIDFVGSCQQCNTEKPTAYATLYAIIVTPKWASYIVNHLKGTESDKPRDQKQIIAAKAANYELLND